MPFSILRKKKVRLYQTRPLQKMEILGFSTFVPFCCLPCIIVWKKIIQTFKGVQLK